ncbi:MAG: hypothetical protein OJF49_001388 [Ktedonobacterales bacterium]|nr:MAG: hypothetical protein OJF49_001388 [Ktedonobacterales bacterium]
MFAYIAYRVSRIAYQRQLPALLYRHMAEQRRITHNDDAHLRAGQRSRRSSRSYFKTRAILP